VIAREEGFAGAGNTDAIDPQCLGLIENANVVVAREKLTRISLLATARVAIATREVTYRRKFNPYGLKLPGVSPLQTVLHGFGRETLVEFCHLDLSLARFGLFYF
jgi:hypothetical protein